MPFTDTIYDRAVIKVEALSVANRGTIILHDATFSINQEEFVFFVGKTGSGKSTLLKALYADAPISSGEVYIAGFHLNEMRDSEIPFLRRKLGIVFQDFQLLPDRSVEENLRFVLQATGWKSKKDIKLRIEEVLDRVNLSWAEKKQPYQLSGGEQQRIGIARALLNDPLVIIADEPTGNLDSEVADEILNLFLKINKSGTAILMATHNQTFLERNPSCKVLKCFNGYIAHFD